LVYQWYSCEYGQDRTHLASFRVDIRRLRSATSTAEHPSNWRVSGILNARSGPGSQVSNDVYGAKTPQGGSDTVASRILRRFAHRAVRHQVRFL